jgi:hypothetical protein
MIGKSGFFVVVKLRFELFWMESSAMMKPERNGSRERKIAAPCQCNPGILLHIFPRLKDYRF